MPPRADGCPSRLLRELIAAAPTAANGELAAAEVLANFLRRHGVDVQLDVWDARRANLVAALQTGSRRTAPLWLAGHLDVVPADGDSWRSNPFAPTLRAGKLFGRGATDMLGPLAAAAAALVEAARAPKRLSRDIVLIATAGEETDSCGAKRFMASWRQWSKKPQGIIVPEPTGLKVVYAHRGIVWLRLTTLGKSAHGSMPHLGINAILKMNRLIARLAETVPPHRPHPVLGNCSISLNRISGGSGVNIVPDQCHLDMDIRILPGQTDKQVIAFVQSLCRQVAKTDRQLKTAVSLLRYCPPLWTQPDTPFIKSVCHLLRQRHPIAVRFTTDAPYFAALAPAVILGPGDSTICHQRDEAIALADLRNGVAIYRTLFEL